MLEGASGTYIFVFTQYVLRAHDEIPDGIEGGVLFCLFWGVVGFPERMLFECTGGVSVSVGDIGT